MLTTLIASRPTQHTTANGTAFSLALHLGVIATMLVATTQRDVFTPPSSSTRIVPLVAPASPRPATPQRPQAAPPRTSHTPSTTAAVPAVDVPPVSIPTDVPTGLPTDYAPPIDLPAGDGGLGAPSPGSDATPLGSGDGVLGAESVDVPAALRAGSPLPRYPEILRQSRIEGGVRVRFVVDENGRAELGTLTVLESTHPAFIESVRAVLPRLRFTPARVGRDRVKQVVEIPFGFVVR
ncbi:TonB family protein [Pseudogemmatithrix spongiicola]|uniref:TonB family protein n=1 Tax=Pseudogemmatithrix spongiicola TaxID=3062599 RepID=A0AA49Q5M4_9BACT|nr:TonB family protein [Gemmatimonadaceae bacterium 'strain 138']WKW16300.1 TonB family protein [Gemmatimonadaceae bacterium 'strain 318']